MANNFSQSKRGVVILFAVLLVSVVLTVSLGIFNITYRQLVLSSLASESEIAFAAADSARNCALYWDSPERTNHPFGYYKYDQETGWSIEPPSTSQSFQCAGEDLTIVCYDPNHSHTDEDITVPGQCRFQIKMNVGSEGSRTACANVFVEKNQDTDDQRTTITVDGYNMACIPTDINRAVQRRIQTVY